MISCTVMRGTRRSSSTIRWGPFGRSASAGGAASPAATSSDTGALFFITTALLDGGALRRCGACASGDGRRAHRTARATIGADVFCGVITGLPCVAAAGFGLVIDDRAVLGGQILAGDALDVGRGHRGDLLGARVDQPDRRGTARTATGERRATACSARSTRTSCRARWLRAFSISQSAIGPFLTFSISPSMAASRSASGLAGRGRRVDAEQPGAAAGAAQAPMFAASCFCRTICRRAASCGRRPSTVPSTDSASSSGDIAGGIL